MHRVGWFVFWLVLVGIAFGASPPSRPDEGTWLLDLILGRSDGENPLVVGEFWLMGVWPLLAALLLRDHWRAPRMAAWPFLLLSFALGCFVLLPWFWARRSPEPAGPPAPPWTAGPFPPALLGLVGAGIGLWALVAGDPADFVHRFRTEGFLWAMTFDFLAFTAMFAIEARSRAHQSGVPWPATFVPVLGAAAWLVGAAIQRPGGGAPSASST